ncbi:MAG TPA: hypothetical protein VIH61_00055 [Waddliaceae bacterium]
MQNIFSLLIAYALLFSVGICATPAYKLVDLGFQETEANCGKHTRVMIQQDVITKCDDPRCAYERRDSKTGTIMHFDKYGNLIGRTKG